MMPVTSGLVILEVGRLKKSQQPDWEHRWANSRVVLLVDGSLIEGTEDLIEEAESTLGPDNESAEVATWSKLEQVQPANVDGLNTRKIPECLDDPVVFVVYDEGATALAIPATSDLSFSSPVFPRVRNLGNIGVGVDRFEESDGIPGLGQGLDTRGNDKRDFFCSLDSVAAGENQGRKGRSCQGRDDGESALCLVNLDVPLAPSFRGSKHTTTAAHVTKSSLIVS